MSPLLIKKGYGVERRGVVARALRGCAYAPVYPTASRGPPLHNVKGITATVHCAP